MTEKSPCAAPATVEGLMALTRKWHFDVLHSDEDADATEKDIRAYAERLAALATPAGVDAVPVAHTRVAAILQEIDYAEHHGWPRTSCERLERFAKAAKLFRPTPAATTEAPTHDIEEIGAVIACLGDDYVQLTDENPEDERAANMLRAAELLQDVLLPMLFASPRPSTEGAEQEARKLALTDDEILAAFSDTAISEDAPKHKAKIDYMLAVGRTIERAAHQAQPCVMVADCDGPIRCTTCTDRKRCAAEGCVRLGGSAA